MSTWEDRMAFRAGLRAEAAEGARQRREGEERARLIAEHPVLAGESDSVIEDGPHQGHRTHIHPWHGCGVVTCSCGEFAGLFSYVLPDGPLPEPERCPVCIARGVIAA